MTNLTGGVMNNPGVYSSSLIKQDMIFYSLTPGREYKLYLGDIDVTANTQQIVKSTNFDSVYSYLLNNTTVNWVRPGDAARKPDSNEVLNNIYFKGANKTSNSTVVGNVVTVKAKGESLIADSSGSIALSYYGNPNKTEYQLAFSGTWLKVGQDSDNILNKQLSLRPAANPTSNVVQTSIVDNYQNTTNITPVPETGAPIFNIFNFAQSFYVDPANCDDATEIMLTSIDLFCKSKPANNSYPAGTPGIVSESGVTNPGVTIFLVPTKDRVPTFVNLSDHPSARREYSSIATSNDATVVTNFTFSNPPLLKTGFEYAIIIKHDFSASYEWWTSKEGDIIVGTANTSAGPAGQYVGNYYTFSTSTASWSPLNSTDLKFNVYSARFANNGTIFDANGTFVFTAKNTEYVRFNELTSTLTFAGQEMVYQVQANATGTMAVTNNSLSAVGNGTSFQSLFTVGNDPEYVVIQSGNTVNLRKVVSVISNTSLTVDKPITFTNAAATFYKAPVATIQSIRNSYRDGAKSKIVILTNSNSNGALKFSNSKNIVGEISGATLTNTEIVDITVNGFVPEIDIKVPNKTDYTGTIAAYYTVNAASNATILDSTPMIKDIKAFQIYEFNQEDAVVLPSKSNEVSLLPGTVYANTPSKSSVITITPTVENDFVSPYVNRAGASVYYFRYLINNDYTNEHTKYGNAYSKHVTTKVNLQDDNFAEDLIVYLTAIRPVGTDLKVYAKLYNKNDTDAFDDKDWTLLEYENNSSGIYSANGSHLVELSYGLTSYPNSAFTSNGSVTTTLSQTNVVGSGTTFSTDYANNDLVKIYSPLSPNNYVVGVVSNVTNNTLLTLTSPITNNSLVGSGFKIDKLAFKYQAFNNKLNDNVARYYNSSMVEFDTFTSFQVKVVFLSNSQFIVPKIEDIKVVPVSA